MAAPQQPWVSSLLPLQPLLLSPYSRSCHQPLKGSHPRWGLVLWAGSGALGAAGHPGECKQGPREAPGLS